MNHTNPLKVFFTIVFGGLVILLVSVGMFSVGTIIWHARNDININKVSADTLKTDTVSTITQGLKSQRFSAKDEEDLINAATLSLPEGKISNINAKAYIVKNLTEGKVVIENNANTLLPIASITKLVTAVIARKYIPNTTRITITKSAVSTYGNTADFIPGETFIAGDLIYPLLIVSSNDAAEAYAQSYGRVKFIREMNDFVQSIGAYRTSFYDPSGLDPKNVSTVNDLSLILDWIRKNDPTIIEITDLKIKTIRSHTWVNPTHFLSWSYYVGGKNGYLPEANRTNASLFKWGPKGDIYALVVLGSNSRDADVLALLNKMQK